jgi:hypothetical protein
MKEEINYNVQSFFEDRLSSILFAQSVAGCRNVKPIRRLKALHNDIAAVIQGEKPVASWKLTKTKKL